MTSEEVTVAIGKCILGSYPIAARRGRVYGFDMRLSLNTLACPAWSLQKIIDACVANGISGIDFRGIASEIDITRLPQFNAELFETMRVLGERKLSMPCFNLSVALISTDEKRWSEFLDETRRYAELAKTTRTRFLRVFGGSILSGLTREEARDLGVRHLKQLSKITAGSECQVLLETHDDWTTSEQVLSLVDSFSPDEVGVVWDLEHPFRRGEMPAETVDRLKSYIRHVQVKDSSREGTRNRPVLLGGGDLPLIDAFAALKSIGYSGWYALETEKRWAAEAPEPEESVPQFATFMKQHAG